MISEHTPPGTKIAAIITVTKKGLPPLQKDSVYTLDRMVETIDGDDFAVILREVDHSREYSEAKGWWPFRKRSTFRYAFHRKCFCRVTDISDLQTLQHVAPVKENA